MPPYFVPILRVRMIINRFLWHGAISPETAKTPAEVGSFKAAGLMYSFLESRGILVSCGDGRYYVDTTQPYPFSRLRVVLAVLIIFIIILLVGLGIGLLVHK
ncbi:MAG: hypothetical protein FWC62_01745 [Firmicutes bacterium]|nr:hypothetical protein [Bacillota bacterium]